MQHCPLCTDCITASWLQMDGNDVAQSQASAHKLAEQKLLYDELSILHKV